jgi:hypothetical protein
MTKLLFACVLALIACEKKKADKGEGPACITAAQQAAPRFLASAKKTRPDTKVTELELTGHINAACTLDAWSPDTIKCFDGAKSDADVTACDKQLTKDQSDKLDKAILEAFTGEAATPAPAEGSATGSGSGS